jgi:tetratricopeptide (TPR) repeat protein
MSTKIGRNASCSCGSGKKHKVCCGRSGAVSAPVRPRLPGQPKPPYVQEMLKLLAAGHYGVLEHQVRAGLASHPESGALWTLLGAAQRAQHQDPLEALQAAARLLPADPEAQTNFGTALRTHGRLNEAAEQHRRAIRLNEGYAEAHHNLGTVLKDLGQLEAAAASFREAGKLKPQLALSHHNLGVVLRALGQPEEAVAAHRRALARLPDFADAHAQLGRALADLGRPEEAVASFQHALRHTGALLPLDCAETHYDLGNALLELGRLEEAAASYRRALEHNAGLAKAHTNLASVLRDLGRLVEAEASLERALQLEPDSTNVLVRLGTVQRLLGRVEQSEANIKRACELDPGAVLATIELADSAADRGAFETAESLYREAFRRDSNSAVAWAGIVATRRMTAADGSWFTQAEQLLKQRHRPRDEARLRFAMGKYLDDVGEYNRAFTNYRQANELVKTCRPPHDRDQLARRFEFVRRLYDAQWIEGACTRVAIERRPIFVVGMPRSGTSLAEQILAAHPAVFGAGELSFWESAAPRVAAASLESGPDPALLESLAAEYDALLGRLAGNERYIVDKMPANFAHLGMIHAALPGVRIIHMQRHPVDTCLSIYFQNFSVTHSYANDLDDIAHYYCEYRRTMSHWLRLLPTDAILEVPYEALTTLPELWSRRMLEFAGLPWDEACLDFHRAFRIVRTTSRWQVRQQMSTASVERWRRYAAHVAPLLRLDPAPSEGQSSGPK